MGLTYGGVFENWEIAVAKKLVDQFKRKWRCFSKDDFEDLLQECLSHWYFVREKFVGTKGASKSTYMSNVIKNKLMDMVAERMAEKRKTDQMSVSLDAPISEDDETAIIDKIADKLTEDLTGVIHVIGLKNDLAKAMDKLTPQQRELCRLLEGGTSIKDASQQLNINRSTVYDEIKRIAQAFEGDGLKNYL